MRDLSPARRNGMLLRVEIAAGKRSCLRVIKRSILSFARQPTGPATHEMVIRAVRVQRVNDRWAESPSSACFRRALTAPRYPTIRSDEAVRWRPSLGGRITLLPPSGPTAPYSRGLGIPGTTAARIGVHLRCRRRGAIAVGRPCTRLFPLRRLGLPPRRAYANG